MNIKNMDKSDGLTEQKIEIGGDISDPKYTAPNRDISLIEIFWENIRSSDSNQARLETENAEENNIESNESIDMRNGNSESADVWCSNRIYDVSYCDQGKVTGDEVGVDNEISLIDFDKSDQIDKREPESMLDAFIEKDLMTLDIVLEKEKIVEDLLKVLRDDDSDGFVQIALAYEF
ncbi:25824_t:CDS:2, partial [Racocetra persica]